MSSQPRHLYEFGPFLLDPAERTLLRDGQRVHLRPKVFDMLLVFVEHSGCLVAKEQLMQTIWPDQFVEEGNINKNVSMLREALGESPTTPRYIETEPRRGYRFVADVRTVNGVNPAELVVQTRTRASFVVEEEDSEDEPPTASRNSEHRFLNKAAVVVVATMLLAAVGYFYFARNSPSTNNNEFIDSIAVLPFANVTNDPNNEYLSDGISENIMNSLSRLPALKVMSKNSVLPYKGKQLDTQTLGKALNVKSVLMGQLTQRGDQFTVSVELVDVRDNRRLWGEKYDRQAPELPEIESEIAREISHALRLRLTQPEQERLAERDTVNPQAYELLLRGRSLTVTGGTDNLRKAVEYTQQAIATDPGYALAYADLSLLYSALVNENVFHPKEFLPKAEEAARKAIELNETLAEGHLAMAQVKTNDWDWTSAERELKRAIELNPGLSKARVRYCFFLMMQGRGEQALVEAKRARELDPVSIGGNAVVVYSLLLTRQYEQGLEIVKRMIELNQSSPFVHSLLGQTYAAMGHYQKTVAACQEAIRLGDKSPDGQSFLAEAYARAGQPERAREILKQLKKQKEYSSPVNLAFVHAVLGDREEALVLLEQALAAHDQQLIWTGVAASNHGQLSSLNSEPRFQELLRRVGLPVPNTTSTAQAGQ